MEMLTLKDLSLLLRKIYFQVSLRLFHEESYKWQMPKGKVTR